MSVRVIFCLVGALAVCCAPFASALAQWREDTPQKVVAAEVRKPVYIGESFWYYPNRKGCSSMQPRVSRRPKFGDKEVYDFPLDRPSKVTIVDELPRETSYATTIYKAVVDDVVEGFVTGGDIFDVLHPLAKYNKYSQEHACLLARSPDEVDKFMQGLQRQRNEDAARERRPPPRIGMKPLAVIDKTSWGYPESINKTETQFGTEEQWVYKDGRYLYFSNGRLSAIQE